MSTSNLGDTTKEVHVALPVTTEELDAFVARIVRTYALPDNDDTYESIATLIMHMPQSVCSAPLSFFADSVNKSRANAVAYAKLQEFAEKRRIARQSAQAPAPASNQVDSHPESTDGQPVQDTSVQKTR